MKKVYIFLLTFMTMFLTSCFDVVINLNVDEKPKYACAYVTVEIFGDESTLRDIEQIYNLLGEPCPNTTFRFREIAYGYQVEFLIKIPVIFDDAIEENITSNDVFAFIVDKSGVGLTIVNRINFEKLKDIIGDDEIIGIYLKNVFVRIISKKCEFAIFKGLEYDGEPFDMKIDKKIEFRLTEWDYLSLDKRNFTLLAIPKPVANCSF